MNRFSKLIACILTLIMLFSALPLSFAQNKEQIVNDSVNEDYNNFISSNNELLSDDYVKGEILFNYISDNNSKSSSLKSIEKEFDIKILETIDQSALNSLTKGASINEKQTLYRASFDNDDISVYELCKAMNELDNIKDCEPNYTYTSCSTFVMPTEISNSSEYANRQKWYFDKMHIPQTWQDYSTLGEGEVVCVIDCGLNYTHNEIKNNLWTDADGNHGYNAEFNNNDIYGKEPDGPAHGSHCAGIIAMEGSNGGLVGVAPKAKIMVCNAATASTGTFTNANLIKSIEYAVDNGADVISMSLGGYSFSFNLDKALTKASLGAVICCAAGNEDNNASKRLHWPSASGAVIGVMALGSGSSASTLSSYSNYDLTGKYYQVAAPGTDIYAIDATTATGYTRMSGTSMATPFMAGICALYASVHPNMSATQIRNALIKGEGEMVKGYKSDAQSYSFKRVTPESLLGFTGEAPVNVTINDSLLNTKVREALNVSNSYRLTNYDLECISSLDLSGTDFRNYSELSKLGKLTYINLSNTNISDADALQVINNLSPTTLVIDFSHNNLTNLDFLTSYNSYLSRVDFSFNNLTNIAGIAGFTSLSELNIAGNRIKDISPVSTLTGLVYLYAPGNLISNPKPVINISMLEEVYFGNYNPNLADMFGELYFTSGNMGNRIKSLAPFTKLSITSSRLHYLNLSFNELCLDKQYNSNAARVLQLLDKIGTRTRANKDNPFTEQTSKLVLLPNSENSDPAVHGDYAIHFEGENNFAVISLEQNSFQIPCYSESALEYKINDESLAFINGNGELYPRKAGHGYVTIKSDDDVKTFFFTIKDTVVKNAAIYNPSSLYAAGEEYKAIVYTEQTDKIKLTVNGGSVLGEYMQSEYSKPCYDAQGNKYLRWIVPFTISESGSYQIKAYAYSQTNASYSNNSGSFDISLVDKTDNTLSGVIAGYNTMFNAKVTLCTANGDELQHTTLSGLSKDKTFKFSCVPNGNYIVKAEKDGCKDAYIFNVRVDGDTFIDDNIDLCSAAGDTNTDNTIDITDISEVLLSDNYGNNTSDAANILCDTDGDNTISLSDISIIISNYSK